MVAFAGSRRSHAHRPLQAPRHGPRARVQPVRHAGRRRDRARAAQGRARATRAGAPPRRCTTRADGRFTYRTRAVASRALQLAWPSHVNDPAPAASGHLRLRTAAAATVRRQPAPRRHRRSASASSGDCAATASRAAPASSCCCRRSSAAAGGSSRSCAPSRTGRFSTRTRFTQPSPRRVVRFRVFVPAGPGLPLRAPGVSNARAVRLN